MFAYIAMIALPSVLALGWPRSKSPILFAIVFAVYALMIGFRHRVGMDWNNYAVIHQRLIGQDISTVIQSSEFGSRWLFWVSANYFDGQVTSNIVAGTAFAAALLFFASRLRETWLAVVIATPFLCVVTAMSAARQSLAIAVLFVLLALWPRLGLLGRVAMVLLAACFHTSALAMIPIVLAEVRMGLLPKILLMSASAAAALYLANSSPTFMEQISIYAELYTGASAIVSQGAFIHVALVAVPGAAYLLLRRKIASPVWSRTFLFWSVVMSFALIALVPVSSVAAGRLSMYFHYVPMIVVPLMVEQVAPRGGKLASRAVVIGWQVLFLIVWLSYANSAPAWLPYESVLSSG